MITKKITKLGKKGRTKKDNGASGSAAKSNELRICSLSREFYSDGTAKVGSYITVCVLNPEVRLASDGLVNFDTLPGDTVAAIALSEGEKFVGMIYQWSSPLDAATSITTGILNPAVSSISTGFESLMTGIQIAD